MSEHDELLTPKEYADIHRLHVQSVYTAIRYGRLPYRVVKVTNGKKGRIRIVVPRESIIGLKSA